MISKVKPKNILAVDFKKCTLTDNGNRAKICRTIILLYCKQTMHQPPFNVFRMCLKVTLLSFRHRTLCNLIMVGWAKNHHIFGPKMRIICPLYNVMILKNRIATNTATESSFLPQLTSNRCRCVTGHEQWVVRGNDVSSMYARCEG